MTKVSYFQRFSQKENHVTNNTLLVLRHFYTAAPTKLSSVLTQLVDDELEIGVTFNQQIHSGRSIPDAHLSQDAFDIFVETKLGDDLDHDQIKRHLEGISEGQDKTTRTRTFLIGLTRNEILETHRESLSHQAKKIGVNFAAITFSSLADALRKECESHETALRAVLEDYEDFLSAEELLTIGERMSVVPCGTSIDENIRFGVYFESAQRPTKVRSKFLGLYTKKAIRYVGEIEQVAVLRPRSDELEILELEKGMIGVDQERRLKQTIAECDYYPDLKNEAARYYFTGKFFETNIEKRSKGGIWGARVFNLSDWLDYGTLGKTYSPEEAAELLRGKSFE